MLGGCSRISEFNVCPLAHTGLPSGLSEEVAFDSKMSPRTVSLPTLAPYYSSDFLPARCDRQTSTLL